MTTPEPNSVDLTQMTRAQRAALPLSADVIQALAEGHGVCVRPLAMRRIDTTTGRVEVVPVPCGSTRDDHCHPCAEKARRLRMAQCREGWHLDTEPTIDRAAPSEEHRELMGARLISSRPTPNARPMAMNSPANRSPNPSPNSTLSYARWECADASRRWIHRPNPSSARPGAGKTPRISPADRLSTAPWARCSPVATGPRHSSP
jgi:hypothetical protein